LGTDAAAELLFDRLESVTESWHSVGRFLAYAPLLVGLAGTMLGLSGLLRLLEDSNPMIGTVTSPVHVGAKSLQGVFYGTLGGIFGSLLASVGNLVFGLVADSWLRHAESFLNANVLPRIPEQRVAIKLEEAVLSVIDARIEVITRGMSQTLKPLASNLAATATEAAQAAKMSSEAFQTAAQAVAGAGDLEAAAKALARGIRDNKTAAADLGDAAVAVRDAATAHAAIEQALGQSASKLEISGARLEAGVTRLQTGLEGHSSELKQAIGQLATPLGDLGGEVRTVSGSFSHVAEAIHERNRIEEGVIEDARRSTTAFGETLQTVKERVADFTQEVAALRQQLEAFSGTVTTSLGAQFGTKVDALVVKLSETLEGVAAPLTHGAAKMQEAGSEFERSVTATRAGLPQVVESIRQMTGLLDTHVGRTGELMQTTRELTVSVDALAKKLESQLNGPAMLKVLQEIKEALDFVRREAGRPRPPSSQAPPPPRGFFERLFGAS
jgi:hypothetical protein